MAANVLSLPSFAKINLGLRVIGRRPDGFHEIFTIFQTVSLCDTITFERADRFVLTCSDHTLPLDRRNLILQAAERLAESFDVKTGASIHLEKRIPSSGGLGGGSSNAAIALVGLSRLWNLSATPNDLVQLGDTIGSDVSFFLSGGGTAIGTGRGTIISPLRDARLKNLIIVTPDVAVATSRAFESLNAASLTRAEANRILKIYRREAETDVSYLRAMENDFENAVFGEYPEVARVKSRLVELGATTALLSGSGASVFGIFDTDETRQFALKALDIEVNWRIFAAAAISRSKYREALKIEHWPASD